jgi:hypothetical protein
MSDRLRSLLELANCSMYLHTSFTMKLRVWSLLLEQAYEEDDDKIYDLACKKVEMIKQILGVE